MRPSSFLPLLTTLYLGSVAAHATEPAAKPLADALTDHRFALQWNGRADEGRQFRGPAADWLMEQARQSQFFLIGEDHGGAETARFAEAVFRSLQPLGYSHIAIEAGPLTAEHRRHRRAEAERMRSARSCARSRLRSLSSTGARTRSILPTQ